MEDIENDNELAKIVGRRFPLLAICVVAALMFYIYGSESIAATLVGAVVLLIKDYVKDVGDGY